MPQDVLTTERLRLRPRTMADLDACVAMDLDPEVHRFVYGNRPDRREHRAQLRARIASGWPAEGGIWVVEWQHAPGFLGWCGLFPLERFRADRDRLSLRAQRLGPGHRDRGRARRARSRLSQAGVRSDRRGDPSGQPASQRVLEKLGLKPRGAAFHYEQSLSFFELRREEFLAADAGAREP